MIVFGLFNVSLHRNFENQSNITKSIVFGNNYDTNRC